MQFPQADTMYDPLLSRCWPVGSVFISAVATDPSILLGFGVWQAFGVGRCLFGLDAGQAEFDVLGETGGEKAHTLTAGEMPAHTHVQSAHNHLQDPHSHGEQLQGNTTPLTTGTHLMGSAATGGTLRAAGQSTLAATATNQAATAVNQNTGGGAAHNCLPPYLTVAMWRRIS